MLEREKGLRETKQTLLFREIPIDNCCYERNQATGEWGWRAPKNKIFRVTGDFVVFTDQSTNDMTGYEPQESLESFKNRYAGEYKEALKGTNGDEQAALELVIDDVYFFSDRKLEDFLEFFDGKWLVIPKNSEKPIVSVKEETIIEYDKDSYLQIITDLNPDSETVTECLFIAPVIDVRWNQDYVELESGKSKIKLIDCIDKKKELFVPKKEKKELCLPSGKVKPRNDIDVWTKKRVDKHTEEDIDNFDAENKDFNFLHTPPYKRNLDLLIAYRRRKEIIIPEKEKDKSPKNFIKNNNEDF